ncbi:MAG TPA: tetratricopeptide repeat protein [Pyrinomonadaceae bacterium]|jgi:tetratricopeptide (TPR) repeat protein|nr:tetratricopeptide repeat protein [Pyrinomonadaceae bacterium]
MRVFLFISVLIFTLTGSAFSQTSSDKFVFDEATTYAREGLYAEALEKYRGLLPSVKKAELAAKIHFNIGVCLYHLGQFENAVSEYQAAIAADGAYQKAFYTLGIAQAALGKTNEAKAAFYEAVRLKKNDGEAWFDLGMVLLAESDEKDHEAASEAFENAVKNNSINSVDAINNIGVIAALNGDLAAAEKKFKAALKMGDSAEAKNNLEVCAQYKQSLNRELIARLIFGNGTGSAL